MSNINDRIRIAFEKENISYRELENKTGISRMTLQRYVTGVTQKISIDAVEKIAIALHTTPAYIMGWEDDDIVNTEELTKSQQELFDAIIQLDDDKIRLAIRILHSILDDKE